MKNAMIQEAPYRKNTIPHIGNARHYGHIEPCSPQIHVKGNPVGIYPPCVVGNQMFVNGSKHHFPLRSDEIDIPLQGLFVGLQAIHHLKVAGAPHLAEPENHIISHANIPGHVIGSQVVLFKFSAQPPFGSQHINV